MLQATKIAALLALLAAVLVSASLASAGPLEATVAPAPAPAQPASQGYLQDAMDWLREKMEADLNRCKTGEQKKLTELTFAEIRNPNDRCSALCSQESFKYAQGDFGYSGSTVLCCCTK